MRDPDSLMWTQRPCPGCNAPVTVPRDVDATAVRLCLACQSWQRVERLRLKEGLAPAIENNLGQDDTRDTSARDVLDLMSAPDAPEPRYLDPPKPAPKPPLPEPEPETYDGYWG